MPLPLSVQLYTLREELADDRDRTLRRLAGIGYGAVEPYRPQDDPEGFRALADDLGLTISGAHCGALLDPRAVPEIFAAARILGTDHLIVPAGIPHEDFTTREGLARAAGTLNRLAEQAAPHGLRIGYHNHWWELEPRIEGRHALEVLAEQLAPEVFLEIDTYWAAVGGADVVSVLRRLGERVHALHIKDGPVLKGEPHTAVGQGRMPVPRILAAAPHAQPVVELDSCAGDMMTALAESHAYLTSLDPLETE
ncbi:MULTISPECIES: sugar phosphate isomerase/epimerase family protein [Streptomyces]|uniref:Sugar phosphate isomerase/epimerase n=1 Tax=Streptomyces dengpaensis TaxID=2049881 RepID=A0ABN5HXV8_9ACTN|nr:MULTISPECIES: sugar phosphate isomerase/epimerase [Streptomyces]AVH55923.1 sugar phosphate isomerase/epimerase [Streptomyces dengpaensis]PIB12174.1 xylose isomerase [Streptomyces sp. HG99]